MSAKSSIRILIFSIFYCFFITTLEAQLQPSYYLKQKSDGLQSNTIYNIHAAKNGLIYIAHAKGISSFDGNYFKNYYNKDYPFTELTNIMETANGEIYCQAFNNIVYKINGDSTEKAAYFSSGYGFMVSTCYQNTIISMGKESIYFYNTLTKKTSQKFIKDVSNTTLPGPIVFAGYAALQHVFYLFFVDSNFNVYKVNSTEKLRGNMHIDQGTCYFAKDKSTECIYDFQKKELISVKAQQPNTIVNFINSTDSLIWICTTNGVYYYNKNSGLSSVKYILKGYNTTSVCKTFENSFVVSTIGNGLIFIPSFNVNYLPNTPKDISKITGDHNNLFIGTKEGAIYKYSLSSNSQSLFQNANPGKAISFLSFDSFQHKVIYSTSSSSSTLHSKKDNYIIKDFCYINQELVLGTNRGIYIETDKPITSWLKNYLDVGHSTFANSKKLSFFNEFVATVKYDEVHQKIFANTYNGIFEMGYGYSQPIKLPEPGCVLKDMACYNGLLYLATKDQGILIWDGQHYQPFRINNPLNDILLKFEQFDNELWILGENAIYCIYDNKLVSYGKQFGIDLEKANNIFIDNEFVYINNGEHIVRFPKNINTTQLNKPRVLVNSVLSKKYNKSIPQNASLNYDDNVLSIQYSLLAYANAQNTHLAYTINNQEIIHLQNNTRQINLNNLTPDRYSIRFFIVNNEIVSKDNIYEFKFEIKPPFYKTWWFLSVFMLSLLAIAYLIFYKILNRWKKETLLYESKLLLEKELDKSMLSSIKAQMNPHFLFNALNTIQSYIYMNDKQNASVYISKFSDLTRSILEMSTKETISLEEEIKSLRLYLELEKMRFEDSFNYTIHCSSTLNKELIKIPSMLVQPYVENAIKHGLLHKKTNRELNLKFEKLNNFLLITIDDNGIGRIKSEALNKIKNRQHTSFAMNANKKRLEILKNTYTGIDFKIIDKVTELGEPCGTQVVITLAL